MQRGIFIPFGSKTSNQIMSTTTQESSSLTAADLLNRKAHRQKQIDIAIVSIKYSNFIKTKIMGKLSPSHPLFHLSPPSITDLTIPVRRWNKELSDWKIGLHQFKNFTFQDFDESDPLWLVEKEKIYRAQQRIQAQSESGVNLDSDDDSEFVQINPNSSQP